jgi:hypothetical protein
MLHNDIDDNIIFLQRRQTMGDIDIQKTALALDKLHFPAIDHLAAFAGVHIIDFDEVMIMNRHFGKTVMLADEYRIFLKEELSLHAENSGVGRGHVYSKIINIFPGNHLDSLYIIELA